MLSPDELLAWYQRLEVTEAARAEIDRIRSAGPSRRVGGGSDNVSGRYPSRKMGVTIQFESHRNELAAIKAQTSKPFNVNFFCHAPPLPDVEREAAWRAALSPYYREFGLDVSNLPAGAGRAPFSHEAADVLNEIRPAVVSFHFGLPSDELLERVRACGWAASDTERNR